MDLCLDCVLRAGAAAPEHLQSAEPPCVFAFSCTPPPPPPALRSPHPSPSCVSLPAGIQLLNLAGWGNMRIKPISPLLPILKYQWSPALHQGTPERRACHCYTRDPLALLHSQLCCEPTKKLSLESGLQPLCDRLITSISRAGYTPLYHGLIPYLYVNGK